jgi:hypothetical protein
LSEERMIKKINKSLRLKWMVFSILLATIPLTIAGFSIIQIYQKDLKKSVLEIEEAKAKMVVEKTEAFLERVTSNLVFLAKDENFRRSGLSHTRGHLENLLYQNDYLVELALLNEKGWEMVKVSKYKTMEPSNLKDQSKSEMYRVASKGKIFYGEVHVSQDEIPLMVIGVPVEEYRGKQIGVLKAQIHLQCVWDVVSEARIGEKGFVYVIDREGTLIAHPDTRQVLLGLNVIHLPMVYQAVKGKDGSLEFEDSGGEKYLGVYKPIKELGWGVIVQVPIDEAYEPIFKGCPFGFELDLDRIGCIGYFQFFLNKEINPSYKTIISPDGKSIPREFGRPNRAHHEG